MYVSMSAGPSAISGMLLFAQLVAEKVWDGMQTLDAIP